jgi:protein-tyrosine phosphatase
LRIDELPVGTAGGRLGVTFCPGKSGDSVYGTGWNRDLAMDLDAVKDWGASAVITLIEEHEFEVLRVPTLGAEVAARGMVWHHLPIVDIQPPDARVETAWVAVGPEIRRRLASGGKVLVHCRGGLGRAGTIAAYILVEHGVEPQAAIKAVRAVRPGAIETVPQERYVVSYSVSSDNTG